jgi:DHA1 family multidrug resistance protein-like MFS transporter
VHVLDRPARRTRAWLLRWGALLPILVVEFVVILGFGALLPILPLYVTAQGIDVPTLGLITAAWAIAKLVSEPFFGWLADRVPRKPQMVVGLVLLGVFTVLPLVFTSAFALFVLRLLAGAAAGAYDPAARGIIVDATDEDERGEAFGLYAAFQMGGLLLGPVLGTVGASLGGGVWFPFVLTGLLALVSAVYLARVLPREHARRTATAPADGRGGSAGEVPEASIPVAAAAGSSSQQAPLRALLNRLVVAAVLMNLGFAFAVGVYEVTWSLFLTHLGASLAWIGLTFTLFGIPVLLLSPFAGRLVDRRGGTAFAIVGGLGIAVAGVLYAVSTEPLFPTGVILVEAVATAFVGPALYAMLASGTPVGRSATAQGVFGASTQVGIIVAALVAGVLWEVDPRAPFWFFVVVTLVSIAAGTLVLAWGRIGQRRTRAPGGVAAAP